MNISMPPGVSFRKELLQGCQSYVFRHVELGDLGRIVVQGLPNGHCHLSSEVAGDPDDPRTAIRKEMFAPLSEQVTNAMEAMLGKGSSDESTSPSSPRSPTEVVESKLIPCERCGDNAALLVFAGDATTPGDFEDYARKMYHKYKELDVPTWIIGPPAGELAESRTPTQVMKVWPSREDIVTITADEFNAELDALLGKHCSCL
jgi:hypothetical protein